jgi:hypothetical protein
VQTDFLIELFLPQLAYFIQSWSTLWSPPKPLMCLVRVVAGNWSLGTQLNASEPDHRYTFFGAKTAATFIQLNADLPRWKRQQSASELDHRAGCLDVR